MAFPFQLIAELGDALAPSIVNFGKLRRLLGDSSAQRHHVIELIRQDQALTFHVVRLTNSAAFSAGRRIDSLEDAVNWIGFREIYRVVGLAALSQVQQSDLPVYRVKARQHWANSVLGALAMESLAFRTGRDAGVAYTLGLLRTVGRVVGNAAAGDLVYPGEAEWPSVAEWEHQYLGISSEEITAQLFKLWNYPEEMGAAVCQHLDPPAEGRNAVDACLLNLAAGVVDQMGFGLPGEKDHWHDRHAEKLRCTHLHESDLVECVAEISRAFLAMQGAVPG